MAGIKNDQIVAGETIYTCRFKEGERCKCKEAKPSGAWDSKIIKLRFCSKNPAKTTSKIYPVTVQFCDVGVRNLRPIREEDPHVDTVLTGRLPLYKI